MGRPHGHHRDSVLTTQAWQSPPNRAAIVFSLLFRQKRATLQVKEKPLFSRSTEVMKQVSAVITALDWLTPTVLGIRVAQANQQPLFPFQAGQYASINFPDHRYLNGFRPFSIASSPTRPQEIEFGVRTNGRFTGALKHLAVGDRATVQGPFGSFTLRGVQKRPVVMLAGGIGITPFIGMIRALTDTQAATPIILLYSARNRTETAYHVELQRLAKRNPKFRYQLHLTDAGQTVADKQIVSAKITGEEILKFADENFWNATFFLCGPAPFMQAMENTLLAMGIPDAHIRSESFSVKPGALFEPNSPWPKLVFATWGTIAAVTIGVIANQYKKQSNSTNQNVNTEDTHTPVTTNTATTNTNATITNTVSTPVTTPTNTGSTTNTSTNTTTVTPTTPVVTQPVVPQYNFRPRATMS